MRKREEKELVAMGKLDPIFRNLEIKKGTRGYMPLMDLICYAYANPNKKFLEIMEYLSRKNFYVGVKRTRKPEEIAREIQNAFNIEKEKALAEGKEEKEAKERAEEKARKVKTALSKEAEFSLIPSMERSIETALEGTPVEILAKYQLEQLSVLAQGRNDIEQEQMEKELLSVLGEKYNEYATHEERVVVFFAKKLLKYIQN